MYTDSRLETTNDIWNVTLDVLKFDLIYYIKGEDDYLKGKSSVNPLTGSFGH